MLMQKVTLTSQRPTFLLQYVCLGTLATDHVYFHNALLGYVVYPVNVRQTII